MGCEWAEMAEIQKKQNPTSVDRSRPRGHLGCKGGCLEYKRELFGAKKLPESGDDFLILFSRNRQIPGLATGAVGHSLFYSRR